jgi:uncharacterized protein YgiM (DUF1202 family)
MVIGNIRDFLIWANCLTGFVKTRYNVWTKYPIDIYKRRERMKIKGRIVQKKLLAILVMIAVCICSVVTYNPDVYAADTSKGVVTGATSLNVRSGPGTSYSKVTTVKEGDVVTILEVGYDDAGAAWYQISTADGTEGWVSATYISVKADTDNFDEYIEL